MLLEKRRCWAGSDDHSMLIVFCVQARMKIEQLDDRLREMKGAGGRMAEQTDAGMEAAAQAELAEVADLLIS